jgi:hypothetical protein
LAVTAHYDRASWVDHVRGLGAPDGRAALDSHAAACAGCSRTSQLWSRLAAIGEGDARDAVPAGVLRRARRIFVPPTPEKRANPIQLLAQLVYDSFRDPLPAGLRAEDRPSQIRFEAGPYSLDLHLNRERVDRERSAAARMVLVGQIAHRGEPDKRLPLLPVLLVKGRRVVASSVSNEWGEFHLEYDPRARVRLQIPVGENKRIEVPLPRSHHGRLSP